MVFTAHAQLTWADKSEKDMKSLVDEWLAVEIKSDTILNNLGYCYSRGLGVKQNFKIAFNYYKKASEMGHHRATNNLGDFYENGIFVNKDISIKITSFTIV